MVRDSGHIQTDGVIDEIERKLRKEYSQAQKEIEHKYNVYMQKFKAKDAEKRQLLDAGKITKKEYTEWRHGQMCVGKRWKALKDQMSQDLTTVDMKARSITQGYMPEVYAINHNFATYQVEHDGLIDSSYTLYNREAVENLIRDNPRMLPYPRKDSPTDKLLRKRKDLAWNREHISNAITQGILQGESIPKIAKRLRKVTDMDRNAAVRNARTMMTGIENKGRVDAYDRLEEMGCEIEEMWEATLDGRTRTSHRWLHGTYRDEDGYFQNGLRYPADPDGAPEEVYNCRCTLTGNLIGYRPELVKYSTKMGDMSYDEWLHEKELPKWMLEEVE